MSKSELKNQDGSTVPFPFNGIGTRISELCGLVGTRKYAASVAGVSTDSLQRYIREEVQPPFEVVARLAIAAEKSLDWVASGEEPQSGPAPATPEKVDIPILDVQVSTGHGSQGGHEQLQGSLAFQRQYLKGRGLAAKDLRVVYAKGDSMEPEIQDGAAMLVNTADTRLDEGCIYVVRFNDHLFAKRVHQSLEGVTLISANKEYPPMNVKPDQLRDMKVIGRVVWSGREH